MLKETFMTPQFRPFSANHPQSSNSSISAFQHFSFSAFTPLPLLLFISAFQLFSFSAFTL
jgi:hypothetical protein